MSDFTDFDNFNDFKLSHNVCLDFDDVMIRPIYSLLNSRSQVNLERTFTFYQNTDSSLNDTTISEITWTGIPIIAANMDTIGTFEVYNVLSKFKMLTALHKFYTLDDFVKKGKDKLDPEYFMVSTGISDENYERMVEIVDYTDCKWICIDVANGYMKALVDFCRKVKTRFPNKLIVAGNVVTSEMVRELLSQGLVDLVKIGIGGGSACLTRKKTGVGCPQLTTIMDCKTEGHVISDGGIKNPCDVAKAFAAGASFVMIGGAFSGHDENPGVILEKNGEKFKLFYGMSSKHAMDKHYGGMANYRASEGTILEVKYKGALEHTIEDFLGGLRSVCTYTNSNNLEEFYKNSTFFRLK